jgi:hypothetical protein
MRRNDDRQTPFGSLKPRLLQHTAPGTAKDDFLTHFRIMIRGPKIVLSADSLKKGK